MSKLLLSLHFVHSSLLHVFINFVFFSKTSLAVCPSLIIIKGASDMLF